MIPVLTEKAKTWGSHKRNTLLFTCEGAVAAIILNLISPFLSMFAKRLGANDYQIGFVTALPAFAGILALIPGALFVDRHRDKKQTVGFLILLNGIIYTTAALTPFTGSLKVWLYIVVISLANWPYAVYNISWQSFFSDVFSGEFRNSAYTQRSRASTLLALVTTLAAGLILAYIPKTDDQRIMIYQVFFALSLGLSILQRWFLSKVDGYDLCKMPDKSDDFSDIIHSIKALTKNRPFLIFTGTAFLYHIAWQMAWPLFFIYQVNYLHANEAWLSFISVGGSIAGIATYSFWNRVIEKKGAKFVLTLGALGLSVNPILVVLLHSLPGVLIINTLINLTYSGFQLALFENLIQVVPQKNKTLIIAVYTTFITISNFASPMLGVSIYKATSIVFAMVLSGVLRLAANGVFYLRYRKDW